MIKTLSELSGVEKYYLISMFQKKGMEFKEDFYMSRTFDYGNSFYITDSGDSFGTVGVVTAEVKTRNEMFVLEINNTEFEVVEEVIKLSKEKYGCKNISIGVEKRFLLPDHYEYQFKSLRLKYIGSKVTQPLDIIALDKNNAAEFARIHNKSFLMVPNGGTMTLEETFELIDESDAYIIYDDSAVGVIIIKENIIDSIAILPQFQGQGYGKKALLKCIELIKEDVQLIVIDSNKRAMDLYLKNGFIVEKELKSWYKKSR